MTPDELRALADALEPMSSAPRFEGMNVPAFCAWLRAQADAQPVGYVTANGMRMLIQDEATVMLYRHDYLIRPDHVPLYTHPAPAAPQAEPKRAPTCLWSRADDDTDTWETACRHAFTIIDGTPSDNSMAFCCYCGRTLEQEIGGSDAE